MRFVQALRRLWRHRAFRRLLAVRVAAQGSDGLLQAALASFVLFSPQRQPDAQAIAAVLAVTLLPFSIIGPFVGNLLDRWSRRQILLVSELCRAGLALVLGVLASTGVGTLGLEIAFYGVVLLAMSLNRFILAALSAALPHTIDPDEYLVANSVVPTVGPAGVIVGAGLGAAGRLLLGPLLPANVADAILFAAAGVGFAVSATLVSWFARRALGPDDVAPLVRVREVVEGLVAAVRHLRERRPAGIGLVAIGTQRVGYGVVTVAMILAYRNYFHPVADVDAALADLAIYGGVTGVGFVLASVCTPPVARRTGVRALMIAALAAAAVFQVWPGAVYQRWTILLGGFLLGIAAQALKICVDTLVQAHVDDDVKGRTFILYDMIFNTALVAAAVLSIFVLPPDGHSVLSLLCVAIWYALLAVVFFVVSGRIGTEPFNKGGAERAEV